MTYIMSFAGVNGPNLPFNTVGEIISKLLPYIFTIAGMVALVFLIWGGIRYMTARGDPKAADAARNTITSAVVGLLIIVFIAAIMFWFLVRISSNSSLPGGTGMSR